MSKRAEEAAWAANDSYYDDAWRVIFMQGYEQAEKDLALTWEDMKQIDLCFHSIATEHTEGKLKLSSYQEMYEEVLKRFNEQKK